MQKLTKFKVIFDLFTVCVYFIQQQNCKLYNIHLMITSEIQSEIGHCSCDSAKFKAPIDFSHHAILCMTLSLKLLIFRLVIHNLGRPRLHQITPFFSFFFRGSMPPYHLETV